MSTNVGDVSPGREFCERVVLMALAHDPEMTLGYLKGVPESCFRTGQLSDHLRKYRALSPEGVGLARLAYRSSSKAARSVQSFLLMRSIEAIRQENEASMHSLMWSSEGLAFKASLS